MLNIVSYLIPLLIFVGFTIGIGLLFDTKFGISLPISFFISTIIVFISQIVFKTFKVGIIIVIMFSLFGYYKAFLNKQLFKDTFSSYGFIGFLIIYFIFAVVDFNRNFVEWDEFMHWGPMIKEMIRLDRFYFVDESSLLTHKDYPPFLSLFETMWCILGLRYSEGLATHSLHVLAFSTFILPLIDILSLNKIKCVNKILLIFFIFLVCFGMVMSFDTDGVGAGLSSLYTDLPIAFVYSFVILIILFSNFMSHRIRYIYIAISLLFITLTKQISITLVLLGCFLYLLNGIINKEKTRNLVFETMFLLLISFSGTFIWKLLISSYQLQPQFSLNKIGFDGFINIFSNNLSELQLQTKELFISKLLYGPITTGLIKFSYLSFTIASLLFIIFIKIILKKKMSSLSTILLSVYVLVGAICYALVLYVLYMFTFSPEEMLRLACWERYYNTYILSLFFFDLYIFIYYFQGVFNWKKHGIIFLVIFSIFVNFERYNKLLPQAFLPEKEKDLRLKAEKLLPLTNVDDKILILDSYGWYDQYVMNYYLNGRHVDVSFVDTDLLFHDVNDKEFWDKFIDGVKQVDYVYFATYDLDSLNKAMSQFTDNNEYYESVLYKVSVENNNLELLYVE